MPRTENKVVNKIYKNKKRTGREIRMTMQIGEYEMDHVILDVGSDANVIHKKTSKNMGEPKLEWSNIPLHMDNE